MEVDAHWKTYVLGLYAVAHSRSHTLSTWRCIRIAVEVCLNTSIALCERRDSAIVPANRGARGGLHEFSLIQIVPAAGNTPLSPLSWVEAGQKLLCQQHAGVEPGGAPDLAAP